jgi:polar amino acid transport system substrate-binding protein
MEHRNLAGNLADNSARRYPARLSKVLTGPLNTARFSVLLAGLIQFSLALLVGLTVWASVPGSMVSGSTVAFAYADLAATSRTQPQAVAIRNSSSAQSNSQASAATDSRTAGGAARNTARNKTRGTMPPDIQRILARGKLVVALLDQENPPFFKTDAKQLSGLDIDLAQALADQLGVEVEFNRSAKTFDDVIKTVYDAEADLAISKLSRTLRRAKSIRFSRPYLKMRQGLLVNRLKIAQLSNGRGMTELIRNLQGKVGVIRGSSYVGFMQRRFPKATVVEFPSWADAVAAVSQGQVLAAYRDELEIKKTILSQPNTALTLQTIALSDTQDSIAIALPWTSQHLLAFVDQYLETFDIDYTADRILQDYAGLLP